MSGQLLGTEKRGWSRLLQRAHRIPPSYVAIILIGAAVQISLMRIGAFDLLYDYTRAHEQFEIDEWLTLFGVLTFVFLALLIIRARELRHEITLRREAEARAARLARHDSLTGLPNRRLFNDELSKRIDKAARNGTRLAVLCFDLDRFKTVNETYGHDAGDRALHVVSDRVRAILGPQDIIARLGGDEFVAVLGAAPGKTDLALAQRILGAIEKPVEMQGERLQITASVGIALYPDDAKTAQALLQPADLALHQAKKAGRNTLAFFDKGSDEAARGRRKLKAELGEAIRSRQIVPYYQPIVKLATGKVVGVEALARWHHPVRGVLSPAEFIGVAEEAGLIDGVFDAILRQSCIDGQSWDPSISVAVNVSPAQFAAGNLPAHVLQVLRETGFAPDRLELEITESAVLTHESAKPILLTLRQHGIHISLDDFGTGYSSLSHLRELPFDKIKIDRSFIHSRRASKDNTKITAAIIELSHTLGLLTTAEGIEDAADVAWLRQHESDFGQGFYFARPMPAAALSDLLDRRTHLPLPAPSDKIEASLEGFAA